MNTALLLIMGGLAFAIAATSYDNEHYGITGIAIMLYLYIIKYFIN